MKTKIGGDDVGRPAKPAAVIVEEKRSHRTKAELAARAEGEKSLLSGTALFERSEVKKDKAAHAEFLRISKLMKAIGKNDALYGPVINRYCMIYSECLDFEDKKEKLYETACELEKKFDGLDGMGYDEIMAFSKQLTALHKAISGYDAAIMQKRKAMFDIEKENCMTVAAALRAIPKSVEKDENPLIKALMNDDG